MNRARSAVLLEPPADALVHALKYEGWKGLAAEMAERMARLSVPVDEPGPRLVVPVPTTRRRLKERGYNQAALIARRLALALGRPMVEALIREGESRTQVSLRPTERRVNVRWAFSARDPDSTAVEGNHVLLVDDVLTTGATASAAASALERAGATGVSLVTFARAVPTLAEKVAG